MMMLAVNAGSSSLKFALHPCEPGQPGQPMKPLTDSTPADAVLTGHAQGLEPGGTPRLRWHVGPQTGGHALEASETRDDPGGSSPFCLALAALRSLLNDHFADVAIDGIAHRVVHGGARYSASVMVDEAVLSELEALAPLAPLHQPHALAGIRSFQSVFPDVPQIACFDTAFHATLPEIEYSYPLPREMTARGIRRYGFHGLSYQYVLGRLRMLSPQRAERRIVMALAPRFGSGGGEARVDGREGGGRVDALAKAEGIVRIFRRKGEALVRTARADDLHAVRGSRADAAVGHREVFALQIGRAGVPQVAQDLRIFGEHFVAVPEMLVPGPEPHLVIFGRAASR